MNEDDPFFPRDIIRYDKIDRCPADVTCAVKTRESVRSKWTRKLYARISSVLRDQSLLAYSNEREGF